MAVFIRQVSSRFHNVSSYSQARHGYYSIHNACIASVYRFDPGAGYTAPVRNNQRVYAVPMRGLSGSADDGGQGGGYRDTSGYGDISNRAVLVAGAAALTASLGR